MSLHLITRPTADVLTLEEAKKQLRQTGNDFDDGIRTLIAAAVGQIDAERGWLGRALRPQTWELRGDGFPSGYLGSGYDRNFHAGGYGIELRYPPLISVDSVKYDDGDGVEQTLVEGTDYRVVGLGDTRGKSHIAPVYNGSWPSSVRSDIESVRVRYTCGYSVPPDLLPAEIKQAVILMVRDHWSLTDHNLYLSSESVPGLASYDWTVTENAGKAIAHAVENLLRYIRIYE